MSARRPVDWRTASLVALAVTAVYVVSMVPLHQLASSPDSYFDHLAWSFLHGRTDLVDPPSTYDLARVDGRWYVPFPPLAALLMLPGIAMFGVDGFNVGIFVALTGGVAAGVLWLVLEEWRRLFAPSASTHDVWWLTAAFAFGSVIWNLTTTPNVWQVAQVTAYLMTMAALLGALRGSGVWTGIALGLAVAGRPHTLVLAVLLGAIAWTRGFRLRWGLAAAVPVVLSIAGLLAYNAARFGSPLDFGYGYAVAQGINGDDYRQFGQFALHYLPRNVHAMFFAMPQWNARLHFWTPSPFGMSLFLVMPYLVWMVRARLPRAIVGAATISLAIGLVVVLLYYNTGYSQFGPRFFLDVMPAAIVLLAAATLGRVTRPVQAAIAVAIVVNGAGMIWWHWPR